jgi:hypothetical protein
MIGTQYVVLDILRETRDVRCSGFSDELYFTARNLALPSGLSNFAHGFRHGSRRETSSRVLGVVARRLHVVRQGTRSDR